jgi:hypothetical protein
MLRLVVEEAQRSVTGIDTGEGRMIKAVLDMQDTEVTILSCCADKLILTPSFMFLSLVSSSFPLLVTTPAIHCSYSSFINPTISSPLLQFLHHSYNFFTTPTISSSILQFLHHSHNFFTTHTTSSPLLLILRDSYYFCTTHMIGVKDNAAKGGHSRGA